MTSVDLVTFGVFILLENHGCAILCVSLLRVFAYHESFLRLGATDLGCVGDFLSVEPFWLHHRTVFSRFATFWNTRAQCTPFGVCVFVVSSRARDSGTVSASSVGWCFRSLPRLRTHQCIEFLSTSSDCCCEDDGLSDHDDFSPLEAATNVFIGRRRFVFFE